MKRWTKWMMVFAAILAAVAVGVAAWTAANRQAGRSQAFADGTRVTLISAEFPGPYLTGPFPFAMTMSRFDGGWRDWLYPKLPRKVLSRFGIPPASSLGYETNSLAVWLRIQNPPPGASPRTYFRVRIGEGNGVESPDVTTRFGSGSKMVLYIIPDYPHRSSNVTMRIYQCDAMDPAKPAKSLTFSLHNPNPSAAPRWTAEPLPATRSTNGLEVTLARLTTGMTNRYLEASSWNSEDLGGRHFTRAEFELAENGHASTNWSVLRVTTAAATGETQTANASGRGWVDSRYAFIFAGALWTDEPAWDITAEVQRTADFAPEKLWVVKGVSLPAQGSGTPVGVTTNIGDVSAVFLDLSGFGPGRSAFTWPDGSWGVTAEIRLANPPPDVGLALVSVTDDRGRVPVDLGMTESPVLSSVPARTTNNFRTYSQSFRVASNAWSLNVTFAVTRRRSVTFRVKPTLGQ